MTTPAGLKSVTPWLTRAKELEQADPVMCYWCTLYAVQTGMSVGSKEPEAQHFLLALMDKLEELKKAHEANEAISDDNVASAYVENFALKVFLQADNEDRRGKATRLTAKKFLAAANFLEVMSCFGAIASEHREKIKYAKWKASDITKAFKEGRTPVPGPPGGLENDEAAAADEPAPTADEVSPEEAKLLKQELEAGDAANEPASYPFPVQPTAPPIDEAADEPAAPDFIDEPSSTDEKAAASSRDPVVPVTHQTGQLVPPAESDRAFAHAVFPAKSEIECPTPPPHHQSAAPTIPSKPAAPPGVPVAAVQPPPTSTYYHPEAPAAASLDPTVVSKIQKHCRWAVSALNYEDATTAEKELRAALALLTGSSR